MKLLSNIYLFTTEEGGRINRVLTGWRPSIIFKGIDYQGTFQFSFEEDFVFPGDTSITEMKPLADNPIVKYLKVGDTFNIYEGSHKVGTGTVLKIEKGCHCSNCKCKK